MRMRVVLVLVLAALASLAALPRPARACSHPIGGGTPYLVAPADDASGVPRNVVVGVQWQSAPSWKSPPLTDRLWIRGADGAAVAATVTVSEPWGDAYDYTVTLRLTPAAPLAPDTVYDVHALDLNDSDRLLGSFRTGPDEDHEAPPAPLLLATVGAPKACDRCCASSTVRDVTLDAADDTLAHTIAVGGTTLVVDAVGPLAGLIHCGTTLVPYYESPGPPPWLVREADGTIELTVTARDLAGNESAPTTVMLAATCEEVAPSGCSATGSATPSRPWFILLLLLVPLIPARRWYGPRA